METSKRSEDFVVLLEDREIKLSTVFRHWKMNVFLMDVPLFEIECF